MLKLNDEAHVTIAVQILILKGKKSFQCIIYIDSQMESAPALVDVCSLVSITFFYVAVATFVLEGHL